jgi:hypothetical protein
MCFAWTDEICIIYPDHFDTRKSEGHHTRVIIKFQDRTDTILSEILSDLLHFLPNGLIKETNFYGICLFFTFRDNEIENPKNW